MGVPCSGEIINGEPSRLWQPDGVFQRNLSLKIIWVGFRSESYGLVGDVQGKCSNILIWLTV